MKNECFKTRKIQAEQKPAKRREQEKSCDTAILRLSNLHARRYRQKQISNHANQRNWHTENLRERPFVHNVTIHSVAKRAKLAWCETLIVEKGVNRNQQTNYRKR
jgi:hypothetical protein